MFNINSSADYYAMLVEDFDDFMLDPSSARRAIHCTVTAHHLKDWLWHDWLKDDDEAKLKLGVSSKKSFYDFLGRASPWFELNRDIAEGAKHFADPKIETSLQGGYGSGPYGIGPYGAKFLLVDLGAEAGPEHRYKLAGEVLEAVVRFWRDFFSIYRPDVTIPPSRHHVD